MNTVAQGGVRVDLGAGPVEIRGAIVVDALATGWLPRRLGAVARGQVPDDFMRQAVSESAGVRLAFQTESTDVELDVHATRLVVGESTPMPASWFDVTVGGVLVAQTRSFAGSRTVFSFDSPTTRTVHGPATTVRFEGLPAGDKTVEIWLPYTDQVELRGMRADAPVTAPAHAATPRWLHHGSSISHGYRADSVTGTWPVVAAITAGTELTNLAFSGSAILDQLTARTMRDTPADLISLKVGINIVNGDVMRLRAFRTAVHGFLDTVRDGHPSTPLLVVSPIFCEPVEECAGPTVQDPSRPYEWSIAGGTRDDVVHGKLSLQVIRAELATIVAARQATDPALHYLDGLLLYGPDDAAALPLPDNLHPGPDVQRLMGERFARHVLANGGFHAVQNAAAEATRKMHERAFLATSPATPARLDSDEGNEL